MDKIIIIANAADWKLIQEFAELNCPKELHRLTVFLANEKLASAIRLVLAGAVVIEEEE